MWEDAEQGVFRDNRRVRSALVFKNILKVNDKFSDNKQENPKKYLCIRWKKKMIYI